LLAQIGFTHKDFIIGHKLDWNIVYMGINEYNEIKDKLPGHLSVINEERVIINYTPLSAEFPNGQRATAKTKCSNLYLAGEVVKTKFPLATMELACESGYHVANAILNKKIPVPDNSILPFRLLRKILPWKTIDDYLKIDS
jgi:hypothetical protein